MKRVTLREVYTKLRRKRHFHACVECGGTYWDGCPEPEKNGRCPCETRFGRAIWLDDLNPQDCCREKVNLMRPEQLLAYSAAGPGPWFQCPTCKRIHSHVPRSERV